MSTTIAELVGRASAMLPVLRERAPLTEELRRLPDETVKDLVASGLIRIGNPAKYGGLGAEYDAALPVGMELGRACGSSAWCYCLWTVHNWWMGHFPEQAQEEFFAGGPDVLASTSLSAGSGKAEPVDGGYRVTGRWSFSSGCDAASWVMVGVPGPDGQVWAMLPRSDYQIIDTWFVSGLSGTGSKDIMIEDAFVPAYRTLDPEREGDPAHRRGWEMHGRLSYRIPMRCMTGWDLAAPLIGIAQGVVDEVSDRLAKRPPPGRAASAVPMQMRLAEASAEVDAARALVRADMEEMLNQAADNAVFTDLDKARYRRDKAFIARLCLGAVNRLFEASGGHSVHTSDPLQRMHRDGHVASHHAGLNWDASMETYGRLLVSG